MAEATILPVVKSIFRKLTFLRAKVSASSTSTYAELENIEQLLGAFCDVLYDADSKQYSCEDFKRWLKDIKSVVYVLDDLLDELFSFHADGESEVDGMMRMMGMNYPQALIKSGILSKKLHDLLEGRYKFGFTRGLSETLKMRTTPTPHIACENGSQMIIGRNKEIIDIKTKLIQLLNIRGPSVLAVVGIGGMGKTALVKLVYNDVIKNLFDINLWVSSTAISDISITTILQRIIESATGEITLSESKEELVYKIRLALKDKRYLLVLDDAEVKSYQFWVELKSILDVGKGGVILITTRSHEVARSAQSIGLYHLQYLSGPDCWSIFKGLVFGKAEEDNKYALCEIGRSIIQRCGGVPLHVVYLGSLLQSVVDEREWLQILQKSEKTSAMNLAYDRLPSHLKSCFVHLALLNQGDVHGVRSNQIFFWSALGLLQEHDTKDDVESCGQTYLMELLTRSMLHDPLRTGKRIVSCKIRDQLNDLAMEVLGEDLAVITWDKLKVSALSRHIIWGYEKPDALSDKDFPVKLLKARKARTFRFGYPMGRISKSFLEGIISNLRCLYILDLGFSHFEELPSSVVDLMHLRVLNVSFNPILTSLPHTIDRLWNLQALYLEGCMRLQELPSNISKLLGLQCFIVTTRQEDMNEVVLCKLPDLKELQFVSCEKLVSPWDEHDIRNLKHLRRLHFHNCPRLPRLPNMSQLAGLEELVIANCRSLYLGNEDLSGLTRLQYLEISGLPQLSRLPSGIQSAANSLQYFIVRDCIGLDKLPKWFKSFEHLKSFAIYSCPKLFKLPVGICLLKSLEELKIKGCSQLSHWCVTTEGFSIIKDIPRVEIDGRLITETVNKDLTTYEGEKSTTSAQISEYSYIEDLKLHFGLFPKGYEFERETLVQLWLAAGYLKTETGDIEELARIYFDSFLKEQYILVSGIDNFAGVFKYIINDDKVVPVSNDGLYTILTDENKEYKRTTQRHVSIVCRHVNQTTFERLKRFNEVRTLLFLRNYGSALKQVPSDMFLALHCLESLDLSGSHLTELPGSIGNATKLRYLDLSFTLIERLPETIDRLLDLRTLKLQGCKKIYILPKGMKKLINLRHLYFDVLGQLSFMPKGIGALSELRTLSAFIVDSEGDCNIRDLKSMNNLSGSCCISGLENNLDKDVSDVLRHKKNLTRIQLRWNGSDEDEATHHDNLMPHPCLEKLEVFGYPNSNLPPWITAGTLENLTSIVFLKCENSQLNICLGGLPSLTSLDIIEMDNVKTINSEIHPNQGHASFPKLQKLTIDGMLSLHSWTAVIEGYFPVLSELSVKHCPKIQLLAFLPHLVSLEYLELSHCDNLESLSGPNGNLSEKLNTLVIDNCPLLESECSTQGKDWWKTKQIPELCVDIEIMKSSPEDGHHSGDEDLQKSLNLADNNSNNDDGMINSQSPPSEAHFLHTHMENSASSARQSICENTTVAPDANINSGFLPILRSGEWSDIGGRNYMEDTHVCIADLAQNYGHKQDNEKVVSFYGVFDGHGGHAAAQFVRDHLPKVVFEDAEFPSELEKVITRSFMETDAALARSWSKGSSQSSGTTAITAMIFGRSLLVANAGDSRAVLSRRGLALAMSNDHRPSCRNERTRVEALGAYVEDGYLNGQLGVTRALGDWHLDGMKHKDGNNGPLSAEPELKLITLSKEDEFLIIGCDGIWDVFSNQDAVGFAQRRLQKHNDIKLCCKEMVEEAIKRGAMDNLTVVMISFHLDPPPPIVPQKMRVRRNISAEGLQNLKILLEIGDTVN